MRNLAFIAASAFFLLSCKCKKEVSTTELKEENSKEKIEIQDTKYAMTLPKNSVVTRTKVDENQEKGMSVEYEAMSRGYFLKIVYRGNSISVGKDRNDLSQNKTIKLSSLEENELNQMLTKFDPKTLPNLKWPTEKRYYDGAAHANLIIIKDGETYTGAGFDHGFPPKEIEKLVQKLISIAEKN